MAVRRNHRQGRRRDIDASRPVHAGNKGRGHQQDGHRHRRRSSGIAAQERWRRSTDHELQEKEGRRHLSGACLRVDRVTTMRNLFAVALAFAALCAVSSPATAQVQCNPTETFRGCFNRITNGPLVETTAEATEAVAAMNTGDNEESTTNDFLPLLRLLLNDGADDEGQKIGFEWAPHFSKTLPSKLTLSLQDSELYAPLDKALDEAELGDQGDALGKQIDAGDDIAVAFTISKASEKYGRDPEHQKALLGKLLEPANEAVSPELQKARDNIGLFLVRNRSINSNTRFQDIEDPAVRTEYLTLAQAQMALELQYLEKFAARLEGLGFNGLLDLIDNQPQFTFTLEFESRDEAVGPDEAKATLAYEFGGRNVNSFRHYAKHDCGDKVDGDPLASQVACLAQYLATKETIAESFRVKIAAEYSKIQRYEFALADTAFSYTEKPVEHLSFSVAASRQIGKEGSAGPRPRFDLKASYEDFSDDPVRQDRGVATATFSYPVSPGFFLTLGAVYATKPEFRGEVDEEISARLGLTYKLIPDK